MAFQSILFHQGSPSSEPEEAPDFFADLNLDQVAEAVFLGKQDYRLTPFFYLPLQDLDAIQYRHEVFQDLEMPAVYEMITAFAQKLQTMRDYLVQVNKLYYPLQKQAWFVDAVEVYCEAINTLSADLSKVKLASEGLKTFRDFLADYIRSDRFTELVKETSAIKGELASIKYGILIKGDTIKVRFSEEYLDYSLEIEKLFEKFKRNAVKDYRSKLSEWNEMNHIEAKILDFVAQLFPEIFGHLEAFCRSHTDYLDPVVETFDREIQFYMAFRDYTRRFKRLGLEFCYPELSNPDKDIYIHKGYDLALAEKFAREDQPVVTNDWFLEGKERIFVVSGPNQGGKTTFARTFGQVHYLASLGCPVPGTDARLYLPDRIFTHFEKQEAVANLTGKLQDDLNRVFDILGRATPQSIIILNEIFTSTTLSDAIFLSEKVLERIIELDLLCVCVTFIDELSVLSEKTVSMVSTVVPENPTLRTFKILRKPADGLAYALSIAEKYHLTYGNLKERLHL